MEKIAKLFLYVLVGFCANLETAEKPIEKLSPVQVAKEKSWKLAEDLRKFLKNETHLNFEQVGVDLKLYPGSEKLLQGVGPYDCVLRDICFATKEKRLKILKQLVKEYKIHLMPKDEDLYKVSKMLVEEIQTNNLLQDLIGGLKIKAITSQYEQLQKEEAIKKMIMEEMKSDWRVTDYYNLPRIVIYVGGGRESAQCVLNEIYRIFKNVEGMNRGPGFNQKVTSLIYFSQGNREDKGIDSRELFEPNLIYYRADVTGTPENYHLAIPGK